MGKSFTSLAAILALGAVPTLATEAQAGLPEPVASIAALYPIPPGPGSTETVQANASSAAGYLARLSPAALAATGGPRLSATPSGPGIFTFLLSAKIHGKKVVLGTAGKTVGSAGTITVKLTLTKAGKLALGKAKGKKLRVTVTASFKPQGGKAQTATSTATLR